MQESDIGFTLWVHQSSTNWQNDWYKQKNLAWPRDQLIVMHEVGTYGDRATRYSRTRRHLPAIPVVHERTGMFLASITVTTAGVEADLPAAL